MGRMSSIPWFCERCSTLNNINGAIDKECRSCGDPFDPKNTPPAGTDVTEWVRAMEAKHGSLTVTDSIMKARGSGGWWDCKYCPARNHSSEHPDFCGRCGAPKNEPVVAHPPPLNDAPPPRPKKARPAPKPKAKPARVEEDDINYSYRRSFGNQKSLLVGAAAAVGAVLLIALLWALFATHASPGQVDGLKWERTTHVDSCKYRVKDDWCSDVSFRPHRNTSTVCSGAVEVSRTSKKKGERKKHPSGHQEQVTSTVCKDVADGEKCLSNGAGPCEWTTQYKKVCEDVTSTKTVECTHMEDVMADSCTYRVWDWVPDPNPRTNSGMGEPGPWPTKAADDGQRVRKTDDYRVLISYTEDGATQHTYDSVGLNEYKTHRVGQRVAVDVNVFNLPMGFHYQP